MHKRPYRQHALLIAFLSFLFSSLIISTAAAQDDPEIKIACVGDSITFGARVENREENNYPKQLGQLLGEGYLVRNFGVSGTTLLSKGNRPWIKTDAFQQATDFNPDIVIIKLGTNDTKPQNFPAHPDDFETDYTNLINHFRELPAKPQIYICDPAPIVKSNPQITDKVMVELRPLIKGNR